MTLTVLAKLGSPEVVGQFVLGLSIAAPVIAVTALHLRAVQATDTMDEHRFEHYFGTRIVLTALGMLVIGGICLFSLKEPETAWTVLLVGLSKGIESVSEVVRGLFERYERMDLSGGSLIIKGFGTLAALGVLFAGTGQIVVASGGMVLAGILVLGLFDLPRAGQLLRKHTPAQAYPRLTPSFDVGMLLQVIRRALPLGIGIFLLTLQGNIPRYVLHFCQGDAALGYFTAMVYVSVLGTLVVSAVGQAASPRLALYYATDVQKFRRLMTKLIQLGLWMGVAFVLAVAAVGRPAMAILFQPEYAEYHREFMVVAVAGATTFLTFFYGYGLTATRAFGSQLTAGLTTCVVGTITAMILVPRYGILGGAITLAVTSAQTLICYLYGLHRRIKRWTPAVKGVPSAG
jgi:O-antigen/teichoic acid export membrane protein